MRTACPFTERAAHVWLAGGCFMYSTPYETTMYYLTDVGALVLVLAALVLWIVLGIVLIASTRRGSWTGLRLGAALGLILGPILTTVIAGFMGVYGSHHYGASGSDAGGVPFFGWSTTLPDLRPAHFVATHLIQALPVVGWLAERTWPRGSRSVVWTCAALGTALGLGLFGIALSGRAPLGWLG